MVNRYLLHSQSDTRNCTIINVNSAILFSAPIESAVKISRGIEMLDAKRRDNFIRFSFRPSEDIFIFKVPCFRFWTTISSPRPSATTTVTAPGATTGSSRSAGDTTAATSRGLSPVTRSVRVYINLVLFQVKFTPA